jgi:hypothetical protein
LDYQKRKAFNGRLCVGFRKPAPTMPTTRSGAAGVRKAPRHEIAVGERRRCRNYGDFAAGSGVDVVERGGKVGNFATRRVRELNCERVTDRLRNAILRF